MRLMLMEEEGEGRGLSLAARSRRPSRRGCLRLSEGEGKSVRYSEDLSCGCVRRRSTGRLRGEELVSVSVDLKDGRVGLRMRRRAGRKLLDRMTDESEE